MTKPLFTRIGRFFKAVVIRLIRLHDNPQRISLGFGLGVFLGILPGTGPIAALVLASLFRVNRAAALLGCLLTNTWFSIATILLSIKLGSVIMRVKWEEVYAQWQLFLKGFQWQQLFTVSVLKILIPVVIGYLLIGLLCAVVCYGCILTVLVLRKNHESKNRTRISR